MKHLRAGRARALTLFLLALVLGLIAAGPRSTEWPVQLKVFAMSDTTLNVTWRSRSNPNWDWGCEPPEPIPYDSFELLFRPVGDTVWAAVGRTPDTFMFHDPQGRTGEYSVRGWQVGKEAWNPELYASTVPRYIDTVTVWELSAGDTSGLGFRYRYPDCPAAIPMDSTACPYADLYVTDFRPGTPGPVLCFATPEYAPFDPGGSVPARYGWRGSWFFAGIGNEQEPVPRWNLLDWNKACSLRTTPALVGCRDANGNYTLIRVMRANLKEQRVVLEAWYQPISGLRLIEH